VASGNISFHVQSPPLYGTKSSQISIVQLPLKVNIIPTPPREKRVLWDVLHSIKYPPGYVPRDNLDIKVGAGAGSGGAGQHLHPACEGRSEGGLLRQPIHKSDACLITMAHTHGWLVQFRQWRQ